MRSFLLDANKAITSGTPNATQTFNTFPGTPTGVGVTWNAFVNVVAVKGKYIWVVSVDTELDNSTDGGVGNYSASCS